MNNVEALKLWNKAFDRQRHPSCKIATDGRAHDMGTFSQELVGTATDEQIRSWIDEVAQLAADFECKLVATLLETFNRDLKGEPVKPQRIDPKDVIVVRRTPITIYRANNDKGELCWRIGGRVGTRVDPFKADPRSALAREIEAAKRAEEQMKPKTRSELLEEME